MSHRFLQQFQQTATINIQSLFCFYYCNIVVCSCNSAISKLIFGFFWNKRKSPSNKKHFPINVSQFFWVSYWNTFYLHIMGVFHHYFYFLASWQMTTFKSYVFCFLSFYISLGISCKKVSKKTIFDVYFSLYAW